MRSSIQSPAHGERVLAVGRAFLTTSALVAIYLDPTEPARLAAVTYGVLLAYAAYSLVVLGVVQQTARLTAVHGRWLHAVDILWTAALTFVSEGPVSPFFLFFLFVVLSAAYRWGFKDTVGTAAITAGVFLVETAVAAAGPWKQTWFASIDFELNQTILRVTYLLLTGVLLGYLADDEKQSRAELAALATAARQPRVDAGVTESVQHLAETLMQLFQARALSFVLQEMGDGSASLWHVRLDGAGHAMEPARSELRPSERAIWLFDDPGRVWQARVSSSDAYRVRWTRPGTWALSEAERSLPDIATGGGAYQAVVGANLGLEHEWRGRLYLFEPAEAMSPRALHFLEALAEQISPSLTNMLLLGRLRSQASAAERARVARELHDGAIQALFGLEMKVQAMRRHRDRASSDYEQQLDELQSALHAEALGLRELMQTLRPLRLDSSDQFADVLAGIVNRFRADTGVQARFVSDGAAIALSMPIAVELVRMVQEALVNVRKHSQASNVLVRLSREPNGCLVSIEDDGVGFGFEGHRTLDHLDRDRIGPVVIKERARLAGVDLAIESSRRGARIVLRYTDVAHA